MIYKLENGTLASFGEGTIKVITSKLPIRPVVQLELQSCEKSKLGEQAGPTKEDSDNIILEFPSVESIDIFMSRLSVLKQMLSEKH